MTEDIVAREREKQMTEFEKAFEKMTPEQRKAATESISEMMGMPPKKKRRKNKWTEKEIADYLEEDETKAQERFADQPGQWIDVTPPDVKKRQAKAWKELEKMMSSENGEPHSKIDFTYEKELNTGRGWLLTWNIKNWQWDRYSELCELTRDGNSFSEEWSCASTKPQIGDEVFLIKLGEHPRGIIGHGRVLQTSHETAHYDSDKAKDGRTEKAIGVEFDRLLDYEKEQIITQKELKDRFPDQYWSPQGSGIEIKQKVLQELHTIWNALVNGERDPSITAKMCVISFAGGKTYDLVRETHIHAHPVKRGFPSSVPEFLMVRGTGGISHELFHVGKVLEFNPEDTEYLHSLIKEDFFERLKLYIEIRKKDFGFKNVPLPYRFYILELFHKFNPPYRLEPNPQGFRYFSLEQLGLTEENICTEEMNRIDDDLNSLDITGEDRTALVKTRINQSVFRERLLKRDGKCRLCNVSCPDMLIASHIKPWAASGKNERVDEENGFLFCPNHDRLFDKGYISFDDSGNILISSQLGEADRVFLNVQLEMKIELSDGNRKYLEYHRERVFRK